MNEQQERLGKAYKRAGVGAAIGALAWTAALLFASGPEDSLAHWLVPICAAALSVLCFSLYRKSKETE
jgi:hypothetical protein